MAANAPQNYKQQLRDASPHNVVKVVNGSTPGMVSMPTGDYKLINDALRGRFVIGAEVQILSPHTWAAVIVGGSFVLSKALNGDGFIREGWVPILAPATQFEELLKAQFIQYGAGGGSGESRFNFRFWTRDPWSRNNYLDNLNNVSTFQT